MKTIIQENHFGCTCSPRWDWRACRSSAYPRRGSMIRLCRASRSPTRDWSGSGRVSSAIYERMGQRFEREDEFIEKAQKLIDRAKENGKDVSAVQAALDAFEAALKDAQPDLRERQGHCQLASGL